MIFLAFVILERQWFPLSPKELIEGLGLWLFGLIVGALLAKKHLKKPAEEHHIEQMEAHEKTHKHLGIGEDK